MRRTLAFCCLITIACADEADRLAKARVFSPEEPAEELQRAKETIPVTTLAEDPAARARVVGMDRLEATRRLGAHKAITSVRFSFARGGRSVSLSEKHEFSTDHAGQFRAVSTNDQDTGLEVIYSGGRAYVKNRYGPFRMRRMDRAQQDAWRDRATPALSTLAALLGPRLQLTSPEALTGDRPRHRFRFALGEPASSETSDMPAPVFGLVRAPSADEKPAAGPDPDTALRLAFASKREVQSLNGDLVIDDATGVALSSKARVRVNVPDEGGSATLDLEFSFEVTPEDRVEIAAPKEIAPTRIAHAINHPLWFLDGSGSRPPDDDSTREAAEEETEPTEGVRKPADR